MLHCFQEELLVLSLRKERIASDMEKVQINRFCILRVDHRKKDALLLLHTKTTVGFGCGYRLLLWSFFSHTAKTQYRIFETNISRKGIVRSLSQFPHSCVCERFIYSQDRSAYSAAVYGPFLWINSINCSQTHEYANWDWGRAIPFLGIHKWDFSLQCKIILRRNL